MATLPLYAQTLTAGDPESWHRVMSPGGYESWQFVAGDELRGIWLTASLSWGSNTLPSYVRRYERYRRRPTRFKPPVANEYCCASMAMYETDRNGTITRFDLRVNEDEFGVGRGESGVHVGANRLTVDSDGKLHLTLRGTLAHSRTFVANLIFEPTLAGMGRELELVGGENAIHRWIVSRPLCKTSGMITIFSTAGTRSLKFEGLGCHDRAWGIRPLAWDFDASLRGVVLGEKRAIIMRWESPRNGRNGREPHGRLISANGSGCTDLDLPTQLSRWRRVGSGGMRIPALVSFGDSLRIENPKVLGSTLSEATATYEAYVDNQKATALCVIDNWSRLRSTLWGRWIQSRFASY